MTAIHQWARFRNYQVPTIEIQLLPLLRKSVVVFTPLQLPTTTWVTFMTHHLPTIEIYNLFNVGKVKDLPQAND